MRHLGPLALFGAFAVAWTWPLALHLDNAIPGGPGDNYSFVWNLWWMRHVLATPGLAYFHTTYLFYPFGTMAATYALAWDVLSTTINAEPAEHAEKTGLRGFRELSVVRRGSVLAAIIFGLSPYLASHLLGHFDLVAAFFLPLFALTVRRAVMSESIRWASGAGVVLAATAYTTYYYVVYPSFFLVVFLFAWIGWTPVRWEKRTQTAETRRIRIALLALAIQLATSAAWIAGPADVC